MNSREKIQFKSHENIGLNLEKYLALKRRRISRKKSKEESEHGLKYRALCTSREFLKEQKKPKIKIPLNIGNKGNPKFDDLSSIQQMSIMDSEINFSDSKISEEKISLKKIIGLFEGKNREKGDEFVSRLGGIFSKSEISLSRYNTRNTLRPKLINRKDKEQNENLLLAPNQNFFGKKLKSENFLSREKTSSDRCNQKANLHGKLKKKSQSNRLQRGEKKLKKKVDECFQIKKKTKKIPISMKDRLKLDLDSLITKKTKRRTISPLNERRKEILRKSQKEIGLNPNDEGNILKIDLLTPGERKAKINWYFKKNYALNTEKRRKKKKLQTYTMRENFKRTLIKKKKFNEIPIEKLINLSRENTSLSKMLAKDESMRKKKGRFSNRSPMIKKNKIQGGNGFEKTVKRLKISNKNLLKNLQELRRKERRTEGREYLGLNISKKLDFRHLGVSAHSQINEKFINIE